MIFLNEVISPKQFPKLSKSLFDYLISFDKTPNNKYSAWILKTFQLVLYSYFKKHNIVFTDFPLTLQKVNDLLSIHGDHYLVDLETEIKESAKNFKLYEMIQRKNLFTDEQEKELYGSIYNFKTFKEFNNFIERKKEQLNDILSEKNIKVKKIYEDSDWLIIIPLNWEASKKYGKGTTWCVTSKESDYHFCRYTADGNLYFFINKKINYKFIANDDTYEVMDGSGNELSLYTLMKIIPKGAREALKHTLSGWLYYACFLRDWLKHLEELDDSVIYEIVKDFFVYFYSSNLVNADETRYLLSTLEELFLGFPEKLLAILFRYNEDIQNQFSYMFDDYLYEIEKEEGIEINPKDYDAYLEDFLANIVCNMPLNEKDIITILENYNLNRYENEVNRVFPASNEREFFYYKNYMIEVFRYILDSIDKKGKNYEILAASIELFVSYNFRN